MMSSAPAKDDAILRHQLLSWYAHAKRDLPWRRSRDPYAIWLSEIMLQQTRVETVVPYFERFMRRFPTVAALAAADLAEVLGEWSGLGYYRRARSLHQAAGVVVADHGGRLPGSAAELMTLPGIGRYTAGAIASIAFGEAAPILDGNVMRVLSRLHGIDEEVTAPATQRRLWDLATALVPEEEPGELNQSLMELGATICTPRSPLCGECPVRPSCTAFATGRAEELPIKKRKKAPKTLALVAAVAHCRGEVLLAQRHDGGLFGGLWEPPMVEADTVAAARTALGRLGVSPRAKLIDAGSVRHVLTHRVMEIRVGSAQPRRPWRTASGGDGSYCEVGWRAPSSVPLSTLARKVLKAAALTLVLLLVMAVPRSAAAEDEEKVDGVTEEELALYKKLNADGGTYARVFFTAGGGKGLRFNNPFRLADQLGNSPESVSATPGYFDMSINAAFGEPDGLQHGGSLHFAVGLEGVAQQALSVGYLAVYRGPSAWMFHGRLGVSILTEPDANLGGELALGMSYFFTGSLGLTTEVVGNLFYGAGTYDVEVTTIPVLSFQGGLIADFEVLP